VADNILNLDFTADNVCRKWLTDVTEMKCSNGEKLYLSAILDLGDKSIVPYAVGRSNNNAVVFETLEKALAVHPGAKPLFHSDRGFQYTSKAFRAKLDEAGMKQSMSRVGHCIDNGPMEAVWGTIKSKMYYLHRFEDSVSPKSSH
jgi:putative transposase